MSAGACRIALLGAGGRMGTAITKLCHTSFLNQAVIALEGKRSTKPQAWADDVKNYDVILDVSLPEACVALAEALLRLEMQTLPPLVVGSTGWNDAQLKILTRYAKRGPVLRASNFSPAVTLFSKMLEDYGPQFARLGYECTLLDDHHGLKRDAPSGTAKTLIEKLEGAGLKPQIEVIREGSTVGTHRVTFQGPEDIFEIRHEALNRDLFARGALLAALWARDLKNSKPGITGFFAMTDVFC